MVPAIRLQAVNQAPLRPEGDYVLYWMIAARRTHANFGLERALERCRELRRPLLVLEALRCGYRWASPRLHAFVVEGMQDNARRLDRAGVRYYPYVEPRPGAGAGLLEALAARACCVITDEFPCFFLPRMVAAAGDRLPVSLEQVDGNGLLPLRAAERVFPRAHSLRRFLQRELLSHLEAAPAPDPLRGLRLPPAPSVPPRVRRRWPPADPAALLEGDLDALPLDPTVGRVTLRGGARAGRRRLGAFLERLEDYPAQRDHPDADAGSGLSPYLHFGQVGAHEAFAAVVAREGWSPDATASRADGSRQGWWGMSPAAESFLDQLITWRELGFNMTWQADDYDRYASLPDWARATLDAHRGDPREHVYELDAFAAAATHDPLWNAAQRQLLREGRLHNYLRMLWGKKILEWSPTPEAALDVMLELNNRYALDGRDPNSYSGIFWCLGRYDRAWGPERPVYGKIRFMSSANTRRKLRLKRYLERYGG